MPFEARSEKQGPLQPQRKGENMYISKKIFLLCVSIAVLAGIAAHHRKRSNEVRFD